MKHTPGTWEVDPVPDSNGNLWISSRHAYTERGVDFSEYRTICIVEGWSQAATNARLIAAAPDLLLALEELLDAYIEAMHSEYDGTGWFEERDSYIVAARAAIARAKGE